MSGQDCNARNRPYGGTITDSDEYSKHNRNVGQIDHLTAFRPWLPGSEWLYCDQHRYVGQGYALFKKKGWKKYFHLSEYPSPSAFDKMEDLILNRRTLTHTWIGSKKCMNIGCGKTFRPMSGENQNMCIKPGAGWRNSFLEAGLGRMVFQKMRN